MAKAQDVEYPRVPAASVEPPIADSITTQFRTDATTLALWWVNNYRSRLEDRVAPPNDLIVSLYNAFTRCYRYASRGQQDTIRRIRPGRLQLSVLPLTEGRTHIARYQPQDSITTVYLKLRVARWGRAWARGEKTGNRQIDQWTSMYGLKVLTLKKWKKGWSKVVLQADCPVNIRPLEELLGGVAGVSIVDPAENWISGTGSIGFATPNNDYSEPFLRQKEDTWVFAFTEPCPHDRSIGCGMVLRVESNGAVTPLPIRRME